MRLTMTTVDATLVPICRQNVPVVISRVDNRKADGPDTVGGKNVIVIYAIMIMVKK